jgi:hypothetical protein
MLSSMKGVKMAGLTQKLTEIIQNLRFAEVMSGHKFRMMTVWNLIFGRPLLWNSFENSETNSHSLHASSPKPRHYFRRIHSHQSFG